MRLDDLEFSRLLPTWMRRNHDDMSLAEAVDYASSMIADGYPLLTVWDKLAELPEGYLDGLAEALHVEWYDFDAPLDVKRDLIRNSDLVHSKKGTVAAVESVTRSYFGRSKVMEWFEYGGNPHNFKVFTVEPSLVGDNLTRFLERLGHVKRHSSKLESIIIGLWGELFLIAGSGTHVFDRETVNAVDGDLYIMHGFATVEMSHETVHVAV